MSKSIAELFDSIPDDQQPLPSGDYVAEAVKGELFNSQKGTPGYKLTWQVIEGDHQGRLCWQDFWLSQRALPIAKRQLKQLGVTTGSQLEEPLPEGMVCQIKVVLRTGDNGNQFNDVKGVKFLRRVENPFPYNPKQVEEQPLEPTQPQAMSDAEWEAAVDSLDELKGDKK